VVVSASSVELLPQERHVTPIGVAGTRTAEATARAAAAETDRLWGSRQRVVLAAKEELMQAREGSRRKRAARRDIERHEQLVEQPLGALEERARGLELRAVRWRIGIKRSPPRSWKRASGSSIAA